MTPSTPSQLAQVRAYFTDEKISELRSLLERATPAPWSAFTDESGSTPHTNIVAVVPRTACVLSLPGHNKREADIEIICAAVNALPKLLALASSTPPAEGEQSFSSVAPKTALPPTDGDGAVTPSSEDFFAEQLRQAQADPEWLAKWAMDLDCHDQKRLADKIAANVGYELVPEPSPSPEDEAAGRPFTPDELSSMRASAWRIDLRNAAEKLLEDETVPERMRSAYDLYLAANGILPTINIGAQRRAFISALAALTEPPPVQSVGEGKPKAQPTEHNTAPTPVAEHAELLGALKTARNAFRLLEETSVAQGRKHEAANFARLVSRCDAALEAQAQAGAKGEKDLGGRAVLRADGEGESKPIASNGATYEDAVELVLKDRKPSPSYLQRKLQISWLTADAWMSFMEREGICTAKNSVGVRSMAVAPLPEAPR